MNIMYLIIRRDEMREEMPMCALGSSYLAETKLKEFKSNDVYEEYDYFIEEVTYIN